MKPERASILERMTTALAGSGDVDVMGALGAAQVAPGRLSLAQARQLQQVIPEADGFAGLAAVVVVGRALTELQCKTSQLTYDQAREALERLVTMLSAVHRWALGERNVRRVAEGALLLHLHPTCPTCRGQQREAVVCPSCGGTGQRPYPRRFQDEIAATLNIIGLIQGVTERAVSREL